MLIKLKKFGISILKPIENLTINKLESLKQI